MAEQTDRKTEEPDLNDLRQRLPVLVSEIRDKTPKPARAVLSWLWQNGGGVKTIHRGLKLLEPWGIGLAVVGLLVTLLGLMLDLEDRQSERTFRAWEIILAAKGEKSGTAVRQAMIYLNRKYSGFLCAEWIKSVSFLLTGNEVRQCLIPAKQKERFVQIDMPNVRLVRAHLDEVVLVFSNLSGSSLHEASLIGAQFGAANLRETLFIRANLTSASFLHAVLVNTDFSEANLSDAVFFEANLSGANFGRANLSRVNFLDAKNLTQSQLDTACIEIGNPPVNLPEGLVPPTLSCPTTGHNNPSPMSE